MDEPRLRKIAASIASVYPCRRIMVYGSRARGDFHEGSDLNLCIVVEGGRGLSADWLERAREVKRRLDVPEVSLDPHVYTEAELRALRKREDPYTLQMLAEEKLLYEQQ